MGLLNKLIKYTPTGAFSFEFFMRKPDSSLSFTPLTKELFFLLAPEEYTIDEGFKVTVTKTINGGWIDDFGNDFKKIKISGSLYSYFFGVPAKASGNSFIDFGRETLGKLTAPFTGVAGIDEFFKLRWIVNRFREEYNVSEAMKMAKRFPELLPLEALQISKRNRLSDYGVVYHDYDDNNHYEVVFDTPITFTRSKDDPFTINYSIEMTALKQYSSSMQMFGRFGRGLKETYNQILKGFTDTLDIIDAEFDTLIDETTGIVNAPLEFLETFNSIQSRIDTFKVQVESFIAGTKNNYESLQAEAKDIEDAIDDGTAVYVSQNTTFTVAEFEDDSENLDDELLEVYSYLQSLKQALVEIQGLSSYIGNTSEQKIFVDEDVTLDESDFPTEVEESDNNSLAEVNFSYYNIVQEDSLISISVKFYSIYSNADLIGRVNGLKTTDFDDDAMVGKTIKIPIFNKGLNETSKNDNLIYARVSELNTPIERQLIVLGVDLKLSSSRDFVADSNGDIAVIYGEDTYSENINDRLLFKRGILNELHPEWGIIVNIGDVPVGLQLMKMIDSVESQVSLDPRTQYAYVDEDKVEITEDKLYIPLVLKPVTGSENILNLNKIIPGQFNVGAQ